MIRRRPLRAIPIAACLILSVLIVAPSPAAAQANCTGLDRSGAGCSIGVGSPPGDGEHVISSSSPPGPTFKWLNVGVTCDAAASAGWTSLSDLDSALFDISTLVGAAPPVEPGVIWIGELIDPATGGTNSGYLSCVGDASALPPLPPPPPTAADIWGAVLTFEPAVNLDPFVRGLTGLDTYMWYEGPTADSVTITLNGYTVTANISAVEFRWDLGAPDRDGTTTHVASSPGSAEAPAAEHTYAQPAETLVVHEVVWTGSAVLTGPGLPAGGSAIDLGSAVLATARDYDVIEVRAPLIGG